MTTSIADPPAGQAADRHAQVGRTTVRVTADPEGRRARVLLGTDASTAAPVLRPFLLSAGPADARVSLMADGALLLAGDRIAIHVIVDEGARLELIEPAGTVAYDMRGGTAWWDVTLRLGDGATLVWHGQPFVAAAGSHIRRGTTVRLGQGARLLLRETIVLGRTDEQPGDVDVYTDVEDGEGPLLVEAMTLNGAAQQPGLVGPHRVIDSILALGGFGSSSDSSLRLQLERGGDLWRGLATGAHSTGLDPVWPELHHALTDTSGDAEKGKGAPLRGTLHRAIGECRLKGSNGSTSDASAAARW